jgi:hypothetical protein
MRWLIAVAAAVVATIATGAGLLAWDPGVAKIDVVKTAGVTGGAVVALYALWLNDRRRRTDEARHEVERARQQLESQRAEHDRSRVADERFARAIELLGHETTRVRVGALHALAGLARSQTGYTQTVLDILCAYLRRPFSREDQEELEVRLTAQRLIADSLPHVTDENAPIYDLNLTKAHLEYFDLSYRQVGDLIARVVTLAESNGFHHMKIHGDLYLTQATTDGALYIHDTEICGRAWFSRFQALGRVDFTNTKFLGQTKFEGAKWAKEPEGLQCAG